MNKIRCLLVDDEPPALQLLKKYTEMIDQLELMGTCRSAIEAFDKLKGKDIDLVFLDIRMPTLNGIDFIKSLKNPPSIILTTAYREYALEGYDLDVIDYLLKPIAFDRFLKAVDRYREGNKVISVGSTNTKNEPQAIIVNSNRSKHKINLKDILYLESLKDYVRLHMKEDRLVVKGNIGSMLKQLPKTEFVRIHRSFAVNRSYVSSYNSSQVIIANTSLPVGVSYKDKLKSLF